MIKLAVAIACMLVAVAHAQPPRLSGGFQIPSEADPPYVDLVTFGVGDRIFEKFGHAAICLRYHDDSRYVPICFNFGVTDFDRGAPLVWDFVRGDQQFWVEPSTWGAMYGFYSGEDRDIWIQTLPLTTDQARGIEKRLWATLDGPDGRYTYDHFFNNCTTRLRDFIDDATAGRLAVGAEATYPLTFRQLGHRGLAGLPALIVLADFVLGRQLEDHPTHWQAMFHPDILRAEVERKLGVAPRKVYERKAEPFPIDGPTGRPPMIAIGLVFALPILAARAARALRRPARSYWLARTALTSIGVVYAVLLAYVLAAVMPALWTAFGGLAAIAPILATGVFAGAVLLRRRGETVAVAWAALHLAVWGIAIWLLVVVSPIAGVRWNEVALVVMPLDAILPLLRPAWRRRYAQVRLAIVILASVACALGVLRQPLWVPIAIVFAPLAILALGELSPRRAASAPDPS